MADTMTSGLGELAERPAAADEFPIVDKSDTAMGAGGTTKRVKFSWVALGPHLVQGRLTTESGVPVSTTDRTAQGTLYFTPYKGNFVRLYSGSVWSYYAFTERSLALSLTSAKNYDVFLYDNAGTLTLELSAQWTNDTTRADALALQDGVYVKSGATTRLWLGTIRASGTNTTEDSGGGTTTQVGGKRFVWNYYNQINRTMRVIDTTDVWSTGTAGTWRQANGASGNKVEFVCGDVCFADATVIGNFSVTTISTAGGIGVGVDSTTTPSGLNSAISIGTSATANAKFSVTGVYSGSLSAGYHYLSWIEKPMAGTTINYWGDGASDVASGLQAIIST